VFICSDEGDIPSVPCDAIDGGAGALDDGEEYMGGVRGTCRDLPITAKL
jgi:hypothetical protein